MEFKFDPIEEIVEEIRQGHIVIMQDPADREMKETISARLNLLHLKISIAWHRKREA